MVQPSDFKVSASRFPYSGFPVYKQHRNNSGKRHISGRSSPSPQSRRILRHTGKQVANRLGRPQHQNRHLDGPVPMMYVFVPCRVNGPGFCPKRHTTRRDKRCMPSDPFGDYLDTPCYYGRLACHGTRAVAWVSASFCLAFVTLSCVLRSSSVAATVDAAAIAGSCLNRVLCLWFAAVLRFCRIAGN
jgi:hypothetical protein